MSESKAAGRRERLAQRRVYVHFNLPTKSDPSKPVASAILQNAAHNVPHTMVFVVGGSGDNNATVDDLCRAFAADYRLHHPQHTVPFDTHGVVLRSASVAAAAPSLASAVKGTERVATAFDHAADVFMACAEQPLPNPRTPLVVAGAAAPEPALASASAAAAAAPTNKPAAAAAVPAAAAAAASKPTPMAVAGASSAAASPAPVAGTAAPAAASASSASSSSGAAAKVASGDADAIVKTLTDAKECQSRGQLRRARDGYLKALGVVNDLSTKGGALPVAAQQQLTQIKQIAHSQLGACYLQTKHWEQATKHLTLAATAVESLPDKQRGDPKDQMVLVALLGQAWFGFGKFAKAVKCFAKALSIAQAQSPAQRKLWKRDLDDIAVWHARALYKQGDAATKRDAITRLEAVLRDTDNHPSALSAYAHIAMDVGQTRQAIPYLLKALVAATTGAAAASTPPDVVDGIKGAMATLVADPNVGVDALVAELHTAAQSASALAFLGATVKDFGAVDAAVDLYTRSYQSPEAQQREHVPKLANMALNLAHTQEVVYRYGDAFATLQTYLQRFASKVVSGGGGKERAALKLQAFVDAIKGVKPAMLQSAELSAPFRQGTAKDVAAYCALPPIFDAGHIQVSIPDADGKANVDAKAARNPYNDEDLNILAVCFTVVKILYVCGVLQPLPALVHLLEPLRRDTDLHLTSIRNEHAYYSCITQVLSLIPFPVGGAGVATAAADAKAAAAAVAATAAGDLPPLYVCGDSHCLSSAWQTVTVGTRRHVITPRLVTGLKCWHLRADCTFYTKRNFESAVRSIPPNSWVVFNFGEIDCREGLLVAVERGKYDTIDDGIALAVQVYVSALEALVKSKGYHAFVHPIVPVLDVTRPVVIKFNAALKARVQASAHLKFLDFFDALLVPGPGATTTTPAFDAARYGLDGTHMSPAYVPLLQAALTKHITKP